MKKTTIGFCALVLAVIITSFSVSGTYARYATLQTGTDTARVAYWKVGEELTVNMFKDSYLANDAASGETSVKGNGGGQESITKVVAPGTRGSYTFTIDTGSIDVETNYQIVPEIKLTQTTKVSAYQPIKFYLFDSGKITPDTDLKTAEAFSAKKEDAIESTKSGVDATGLETAIKNLFSGKVYDNTTKPNTTYTIVWEWEIGTDVTQTTEGKLPTDDNNAKDTSLGKSAAASEGYHWY